MSTACLTNDRAIDAANLLAAIADEFLYACLLLMLGETQAYRQFCQDLVVPKAQNAIAFLLQEITSLGFRQRGALMLASVDFHDQPGLVAREVGN